MDFDEFYKDAKQAIQEAKPRVDRRPIYWIIGLVIILIFVVSIIPAYSIKTNPPPDFQVIKDYTLTNSEIIKLESIDFDATSSIQKAIERIAIADYRDITVRLVTSACKMSSDLCYAQAIYYFVRDHAQYVSDPSTQYVESPAEVLLFRGSDCEGIALATAIMS